MSFKNVEAFKKRLAKKLITNGSKNALQAVTRSTLLVENVVQKSIKNKGTGRIYTKGGVSHTASIAGQPPATDQGNLANNITIDVSSKKNGSVVGQIISSAKYSKALEFGTTNIEARPFMQPALRKSKKKILSIFKQEGVIRK
tara:strand:+ start:40 stop:468 length:429 start_codon:yes stop_codon:yes gene_type:complete